MDNRFILSTLDQVEREKKGYEILEDKMIKCGDCDKKLVNVVKIKESSKQNIILVNCPYCGGTSFKYRSEGEIIMQAVPGLIIDKIDTDTIGQTFSTIIDLVKAKVKT